MLEFLTSVEKKTDDDIFKEIVCHLSLLKTELMHYLSDITSCTYSLNSFFINSVDVPMGTGEQEELMNIQTDEPAKIKHKECCPINFCLSMVSSYLNLAGHNVSHSLIFPSTWECEQKFLVWMNIKSKSRNHLAAPEHDFQCSNHF